MVRPLGWLLFAASAAAMHSQTLPPTPPTSLPNQSLQSTVGTTTTPSDTAHHAEVLYANGEIQVRADNSSLNQILRSISHQTGLKITGGVNDQRVFGNYGPGPISTVLATLLDGTGTNLLLLGGNTNTPPELILTPKNGGAEPPGPNSPTYAMYDDSTDRQSPVPPPGTQVTPSPPKPQTPVGSPDTRPSPNPASNSPVAPSAAPAGKALTPEMVMQELQQMQQQQNQRKQQLDQQIQKEQLEQSRKLGRKQNPPTQTPASPQTPQ